MAQIRLQAFFTATTSIYVVALELPRLVARDVPCCLLSRPPVSRLGHLHTLSSETNERHNFKSQSPGALATNDTQWSARGVEPVCFVTGHQALFHMKQRASPSTELAVSETVRGAPTLDSDLSS